MMNWLDILENTGIVPVVTAEDPSVSGPLASALTSGGLGAAEITFRTSAAASVIAGMREAEPGLLVGAGTVLGESDLKEALAAGACFVVAPGFNPKIAEAALTAGVPFIPGIMTPTEIEAAMGMGFTALKFFPAEAAGGARMLKAFSAPYRTVRFMPTGGITLGNAADYLRLKCVFCCGGSFIADKDRLARGDFDGIRETAAEVKRLVLRIRGGEGDV